MTRNTRSRGAAGEPLGERSVNENLDPEVLQRPPTKQTDPTHALFKELQDRLEQLEANGVRVVEKHYINNQDEAGVNNQPTMSKSDLTTHLAVMGDSILDLTNGLAEAGMTSAATLLPVVRKIKESLTGVGRGTDTSSEADIRAVTRAAETVALGVLQLVTAGRSTDATREAGMRYQSLTSGTAISIEPGRIVADVVAETAAKFAQIAFSARMEITAQLEAERRTTAAQMAAINAVAAARDGGPSLKRGRLDDKRPLTKQEADDLKASKYCMRHVKHVLFGGEPCHGCPREHSVPTHLEAKYGRRM